MTLAFSMNKRKIEMLYTKILANAQKACAWVGAVGMAVLLVYLVLVTAAHHPVDM